MTKPWKESGQLECILLVSFWDLRGYARVTESRPSGTIFDLFAYYFRVCGDLVEAAGGHMVKCIGDAGLAVFEPAQADAAITGLIGLRDESDRIMRASGLAITTVVRAHVGAVTAGLIGPVSDQRWDVYGHAVNVTARLGSTGFLVSPAAHAILSAALAARFRENAAANYVLGDEPRGCPALC